jgi:hypothetical protein
MSDTEHVNVQTGEVIEVPAIKDDMLALVKDADKPVYQAMLSMTTLDWKNLLPHQTALLLMQKPLMVTGGGTMYLSFRQALLYAVRCFELGISPFSDNVWFDPNRSAVNLTLSGKRELARLRGIDLGPPMFEELTRDWHTVSKMTTSGTDAKNAGFAKDVGCKCTIRVGDPAYKESVNYTAWISDWYVGKSPVWQNKPTHMLTIRANEKAITLALGTGISAMPDEKELE